MRKLKLSNRVKVFAGAALVACAVQFGGATAAWAQSAKSYQVTGPVLEVNDKVIVVQKGNERWEIAKDERTRIDGEVKVGSKVTVHYRMTAVSVETKEEKGGAKKKVK